MADKVSWLLPEQASGYQNGCQTCLTALLLTMYGGANAGTGSDRTNKALS
jgi:hypothetical protein